MAIPTNDAILAQLQGKPAVPTHEDVLANLAKPAMTNLAPVSQVFPQNTGTMGAKSFADYAPANPKEVPVDVQEGLKRLALYDANGNVVPQKVRQRFLPDTQLTAGKPTALDEITKFLPNGLADAIQGAAKTLQEKVFSIAGRSVGEQIMHTSDKLEEDGVDPARASTIAFYSTAARQTGTPEKIQAARAASEKLATLNITPREQIILNRANFGQSAGTMLDIAGFLSIPEREGLAGLIKAAQSLEKGKAVETITQHLVNAGIPETIAKDYAPEFAKASAERIKTGIDSLDNIVSTTKAGEVVRVGVGTSQYSPEIVANATKIAGQLGIETKKPERFEGFGDITTSILEDLKGRSTISKQYLLDAANRPELKQAERDLLLKALEDEGTTVNVQEFADKMRTELLPLKRLSNSQPRYESIGLGEDMRGPVSSYSEHIYSSPVKTSAGEVHFGRQENIGGYFAHTRIEDLPAAGVTNEELGGTAARNWEKYGLTGNTRRIIELQSDLFQKGRLEGEIKDYEVSYRTPETSKGLDNHLEGLKKLEPYRNTWQERIIREEVKQAAKDGKTKLQFPTGETAMKIEGLGEPGGTWYTAEEGHPRENILKVEDLKLGLSIYGHGNDWIVTDVLGDGKFKAVPKSVHDSVQGLTITKDVTLGKTDVWIVKDRPNGNTELFKTKEAADDYVFEKKQSLDRESETFDISGKIDTANPIYKFYEKEVGRYLTNKYGAKVVTDPQGVKWYEVNVPKSAAMKPVHAFGGGSEADLERGFYRGRTTDPIIRRLFKENEADIKETTGKYSFETPEEAKKFLEKEKGKERFSNVLNAPFKIEQVTIDHIFDNSRSLSDIQRRAKLVGPGLEIVEDTGVLVAVDDISEPGTIYYDIIGKGPKNEDVIIRAKLSEQNKNGKVYFTVSDISGGTRVPATPSSSRSHAGFTTSENVQGGAPVPTTPSSGRRPGRLTASGTEMSIPLEEEKSIGELPTGIEGTKTPADILGSRNDQVPEATLKKAAQDWEENYATKYAELDTADQIRLEQEFKDKWEPLAKPQTIQDNLPDVPGIETPAETFGGAIPPKERTSFGSLFSDFFKKANAITKVHFLDYFRTPEFVLEKLGLGKEGQALHEANDVYRSTLKKEITTIQGWKDRVDASLSTHYRLDESGKYVEDVNGLTISPQEASRIIFKYLDGNELAMKSQMNPEMYTVAREIRDYLRTWADRLKLPDDSRVARYITRLFDADVTRPDFEANLDPELAAIMRDKVAGSVYDPFLQRRLGMQGYKEDVWGALDAYVKRGSRKEAFDPALEALDKAAKKLDPLSYDYVKKFSHLVNMRPTELDKLVDSFIKQSPIGGKLGERPVAKVTQKIRQAFYRGFLGLNPSSALRNLSQGANTYAKLGEKYTIIGYTKLFSRMVRRDLQELYDENVLDDAFIQDKKIGVYKTILQKMDPMLFAFFDTTEKINRGAAYFGAKEKYLAEGMTEQKAIQAAKRLVRETQFAFGRVDTPVFLNQDIVKMFTQLGTYNIKQIEFLSRMIQNKEFGGLIRYTAASLAFVYTIGKLFGMTIDQLIPSVGLGNAPAVSTVTNAATAVSPSTNAKDRAAAEKQLGTKLMGLIPGGSQMRKTFQGGQAVAEGQATSQTGKKQYGIPQTTMRLVQAMLFGKSALPEAQESFSSGDELRKGLETQTEMSTQLGLQAEEKWKELKELKASEGAEAVAAQWAQIGKDNPLLLDKIKQVAKDEELGLDSNDRLLKMYGVANGMRAQRIADEINALKTKEEKQALWKDYVAKKLITPDVAKQLETLLNNAATGT